MNRANSALAAADVKLKQVYEESDNFMNGIYSLFSAYERKAQDLLHGDLEEITRLKNPDKPTRIAMYTVGFLLNLFNKSFSEESDLDKIVSSEYMRLWYSSLTHSPTYSLTHSLDL